MTSFGTEKPADTPQKVDDPAQSKFESFKSKSLPLNAFGSWASLTVNLLTTIVLTPYVISALGKDGYGIWSVVTSIIGYYGILNLGVSAAVSRYIAKSLGEKDSFSLNRAFSTAFFFFIAVGLALTLIVYFGAPFLRPLLKIGEAERESFTFLIRTTGIAAGFAFSSRVMSATLAAHELFGTQSILTIIEKILYATILVSLISSNVGIESIAISTLSSTIVVYVANIVIIWRLCPWIKISPTNCSLKTLKDLINFGFANLILSIAALLRTNLDSILIARFISTVAVTSYAIPALIIRQVFNIINSGTGVLTPRFARLIGEKDQKGYIELAYAGIFASSTLAFGAGLIIYTVGEQLIELWIGERLENANTILMILSGSYIISMAQTPAYGILSSINKHRYLSFAIIAEAIANVILSLVLVHRFGAVGIAFGTFLPMLIIKVIIQPRIVCSKANLKLAKYWGAILPNMTIAGTMVVSYKTAVESLFPGANMTFYSLIATIVSLGTVYLLLTAAYVKLSKTDLTALTK